MKLIKDPVHGYITLSDWELRIVDTFAVQRLRRIGQLPLAYLVYPGARHTRFDHSLGSMVLAEEFAKSLGLQDEEARVFKAAALLHDVGHTPFSHLFEEFLIEKGFTHEDVGRRIIVGNEELRLAIEEAGIDLGELIRLLEGRHRLSKLVSGPIDVDRLDFLLRDSYFTGATYGVIDVRRLIYLTKIEDGELCIDERGRGVLEELAVARLHSFLNIYFHHAVRAAQLQLLRAAEEYGGELTGIAELTIEDYLNLDDFTVWCMLKNNPKSRSRMDALSRRILPKIIFEGRVEDHRTTSWSSEKRRRLEEELAETLNMSARNVYIDSSVIPPLTKYGPAELTMKVSGSYERRETRSWILEMTAKPIYIVRAYVDRGVGEYNVLREKAQKFFKSRGLVDGV
ncbi:Deoxyguanosinetriphosphate triphosphohydrolase-like protein [Candidatus Calditenuaceae archaeon HR02]|nr:Deoxyguanosinetriphosphate triphosphohydrolase-like protein [Candidatus Calditenuaceae archaeon HR02]